MCYPPSVTFKSATEPDLKDLIYAAFEKIGIAVYLTEPVNDFIIVLQ